MQVVATWVAEAAATAAEVTAAARVGACSSPFRILLTTWTSGYGQQGGFQQGGYGGGYGGQAGYSQGGYGGQSGYGGSY